MKYKINTNIKSPHVSINIGAIHMKNFRPLLIAILCFFVYGTIFSQADFNTSLHKTRAGKNFWYGKANGGFEQLTNVAIDSGGMGCTKCHGPLDADGVAYPVDYTPGCVDCHPTNSAFNPDSIKVDQCLGCHSRQKTEAVTLGYTDVHRTAGFKCWDCHTSADMHGTSTVYNSMLEPGAITVDCDNCHNSPATLPDHSSYDPHGGKIHCTACHAKTVASCYSCHLESQIVGKKRAKQTLHNFVMLVNRTKDNKVYPATFQSLTFQGNAWAAFGPFTSHTIDSTGRKCVDCHQNFGGNIPAIAEYNATGEIYFAKWNALDSTITAKTGIVPIPADYQRSLKMDYITYNGAPTDPVVPSKNWSPIGKSSPDGHQMFFATPLTKYQMSKLGFDTTLTTDVRSKQGNQVPEKFELLQNYPNPFNPSTSIEFHLPKASLVTLTVYDVIGHEVGKILKNQSLPAGIHTATFSPANLPSGLYFYKLETNNMTFSRKMLLMK